MFRLIAKIPNPLWHAAAGSAGIAFGYALGSQQPAEQSKFYSNKKNDVKPSLRAPSREDQSINLALAVPAGSNVPQAHGGTVGMGDYTVIAVEAAEKLVRSMVHTHTKSIREPLDFKLLFDAARIIRQTTLKNDGARYRAFVNLCTELRHRHGHELTNSEFDLLKKLIFDEINISVAQGNIKTSEQEAKMLRSVAAAVWKGINPHSTLPEWLVDIATGDEVFVRSQQSSQQLPEQLISRLDEERDKSNAQQMAANLYNAGLADISIVSSAYEAPLLKLQHYLTSALAQPTLESRSISISPNFEFYQSESPYHSMEDLFAVNQLMLHKGQGTLISLCDGHGGRHVADYVITEFPNIFAKIFSSEHRKLIEGSRTGRDPSKPGQLMKGTEQACLHMQHELLRYERDIDKQIQDQLNADSDGSAQNNLNQAKLLFEKSARDTGSTALFVLDYQGCIALFHVGDTRATIVKKMEIEGIIQRVSIAATEDHKPEVPRVYRHISKLGGFISRKDEDAVYRVDGRLAVGRAFGDHHCFAVQPIPTVTKIPPGIDTLILGTDGLWDVIPSWAAGPLLDIFDDYFDSPADNINQEEALLNKTVVKIMQDININKLGFDDPQLRDPDIASTDQLKFFLTDLKHFLKENKPDQRDAFVLTEFAKFLGSEDDITVVILSLQVEKGADDNLQVIEKS